ncbi:hypothetical protein VHEMI04981 [[Torrubiella] hemipterigena]|uniref:tetrahydrofolate synthase n=1 Tax=[Torrubiella] hemipterigena TaxID=1531966 RepID=A0A0A1T2U2_9HYPO|nr:hypothetical protein VHEMI04981 [[Torrubiella] hemipterigena]
MRISILRCRIATRTAKFICLAPRRTVATIAGRSYNDAVDALNSLQTPFALIEARRKAGIRHDEAAMAEMQTYLKRIGYSPDDLNSINIVHVAGTKGKGSTCAFIDSILGQCREKQLSLRKSGLFISPHLISVRERIRINSKPISESLFAKYFFEVWDRLGNSTVDASAVPLGTRPLYGRYLTLMSWHVFIQEGVDVAVYETGLGGQFDATNLVSKPLATGITTLGIDHVQVLGHTIEEIAWHKAGIMKTGSPAYTVPQLPAAMGVLDKVAAERGVDMKKLELDTRLAGVKVQPDAEFQKMNASLAIALAEEALKKTHALGFSADPLPTEFVDGIEQTVFRGRCEVKTERAVTWYIDGAHTSDSLRVSSEWFATEANKRYGIATIAYI